MNFAMRTKEQSQKFPAYKGTFKVGEEANVVKYLWGHKRKHRSPSVKPSCIFLLTVSKDTSINVEVGLVKNVFTAEKLRYIIAL
jgi:hypothetical protein